MPEYLIGPNGKLVKVTALGELFVHGTVDEEMHHQNEHEGEVFVLPFDAIDPDATDKIFGYIQNTDSDKDIHIRHFRFNSTVAGYLEIIRVTGTAAGGSDVVLTNENHNFSAQTPEGKFQSGTDITGLTDGGKHEFLYLPALTTVSLTVPHDIILGKNGAIALNWVPSTGILTGTVKFFTSKPSEE